MAYPKDIKIIDCMLGIPDAEDRGEWFAPFRPLIKDAQTLQQFAMPAQYMFKGVPDVGACDDYIAWTVEQMDRFNIERARQMLDTSFPTANAAVKVLEELGIVAELTGQKKNRSYSYQAYIELLSR